jgi:signal transduction histidine kinase
MRPLIKRLRIDNRVRAGYILAFLLLLTSYLITLYTNRQLSVQERRVSRSYDAINKLEMLLSKVKDAETGFRGYCLSRDKSFLDPFFSSHPDVVSLYGDLRERGRKDSIFQKGMDSIGALLRVKYGLISAGILDFTQHHLRPTDSLRRLIFLGKTVMDDLREVVASMQIHERTTLSERSQELAARFSTLNSIIVASLVLAFLMIGSSLIVYIKENRSRRESEHRVRHYQEELHERINELASANKELIEIRSQEKLAATGRIARTIAHEVRNPLTNINLAVEQLKESLPRLEDNELLFQMILRNSGRINQLISDLLESTKFSELNYAKVSINKLLDEVLAIASDRIALHKIKIVRDYATDLCDINADAEKLKIALLNIIVNAIEATEIGRGELKLSTKKENNKCVVEITDNGIGMDKESLSRLFEPYFTKKPKGTGLGLTNSQNIILHHKGTIRVLSEPGRGSSFFVTMDMA